MHCLGNVWNTMAQHKALALIQYLLKQFAADLKAQWIAYSVLLIPPFLYLRTDGFFFTHCIQWNQSVNFLYFSTLFLLYRGYICAYVKQLVPYRLFTCLFDSLFCIAHLLLSLCVHCAVQAMGLAYSGILRIWFTFNSKIALIFYCYY